MTVKTDANTTGLFGPAVLTTSEATWNVPKDERKSYVAAVRDGRDGHVNLWWEPAADTYYVYRTNGNGTRTLLTGEPLSQPGVNLDEDALFAAGVDPLDLFEVDGLSGAGLTVLGGTPNPGVIPPPGGGGGSPGPISDCEITCTPSGCTITGPKHCHLPGRTSVSIVYFSTDHLGTPRAVSDSNGNLLSQHDYEPFGLEIPAYTASSHTHRFTGHERDVNVGLDYMHARYYPANDARFLSTDSIGPEDFLPDSQNPYAYVSNNPLVLIDPEGEAAQFDLWSGVGDAAFGKEESSDSSEETDSAGSGTTDSPDQGDAGSGGDTKKATGSGNKQAIMTKDEQLRALQRDSEEVGVEDLRSQSTGLLPGAAVVEGVDQGQDAARQLVKDAALTALSGGLSRVLKGAQVAYAVKQAKTAKRASLIKKLVKKGKLVVTVPPKGVADAISKTVAREPYLRPEHILKAVAKGTRSGDPKGKARVFLYSMEQKIQGKTRTVRVIVDESGRRPSIVHVDAGYNK